MQDMHTNAFFHIGCGADLLLLFDGVQTDAAQGTVQKESPGRHGAQGIFVPAGGFGLFAGKRTSVSDGTGTEFLFLGPVVCAGKDREKRNPVLKQKPTFVGCANGKNTLSL